MRTRALLASLWIVGLLGSTAVMAQSGTQAVLTGHIVDKDGNPMPGVTVTAHSQKAAMQPAGTVTDADGRYRLAPLRPSDDYILVAELPGFAKVEISPIDLDPGKTTTQNVTLVPSTETTEKVTIVAKGDIVDVASTKTATVFNSEFIEGLPIIGRTYQDILTLAPGVTDVDGDGNPNVNGARSTDFQTRVDGMNTTDPVTGTFGQNLNLESIAEIEVITTGASAEFSQAQGGFANIITKSGGNDFEGSAKFFFRSDLFDNDGANNSDIRENTFQGLDGFRDVRPFLTLGGPIVKDKLWYFGALQYIDQETPVNTLTGTVLQTQEGWNNFGKVTWQPNPSHRLALSNNWDPREFTGFNLATGVAPESDFVFQQGGFNLQASWTYNISPALLLETRLQKFDTGIDVLPTTDPDPCLSEPIGAGIDPDTGEPIALTECNPFAEDVYTIDIVQGTINGPFFLESRDERTRDAVRADLSVFVEGFGGTHNIKTGFEYADEGFSNTISQRRIRNDDFVAGGGNLGGGNAGDISGSVQFTDFFPNVFGGVGCIPKSSTFDSTNPQDVSDLNTCGRKGLTPINTPALEAEKDNYGFYVQDAFKPRPNLTVNLGLRFDREEASTSGFTLFEAEEQAALFLDGLVKGSGQSLDDLFQDDVFGGSKTFGEVYTSELQDPKLRFDINDDGRDPGHCSSEFELDRYDNSLVTGFIIAPNGTYTLLGDESVDVRDGKGNAVPDGIPDFFQGDGIQESFFSFTDGGGDLACTGGPNRDEPCQSSADCPNAFDPNFPFACLPAADGVARFDPQFIGVPIMAAGDYGIRTNDYSDSVLFDPMGDAGNDNVSSNPNCDFNSLDTFALFSVFSRHQLDLENGPVDFPGGVENGVQVDNNCDTDFLLPGTCRDREEFTVTNNNLAPRFSVSWDPWANNKTKVFATWSRFYDKLFLSTIVPELGPDPRNEVYDAADIDDGVQAMPIQTGRFSTTQVDREMKTPFVDEFTLGFERELAPEWSIGVTYINRDGRDQLQDIDTNHFVQDLNNDGILDDNFGRVGAGTSGDNDGGGGGDQAFGSSSSAVRAPDDQPDLFGWNPLFNQILRVGNFNVSDYESIQIALTRRLSRQWQMTASYVWSEAKGNAEAFLQNLGNDPGTTEDEFGFLSFDQTHVVKFNAVTFLPGDQSIGAAIQYASGTPYSQVRFRSSCDIFDSCFLRTTFPTGQRNDQRNEVIWNIDLNYKKNFTFGKNHASLGVEVQDLMNSDDLIVNAVDTTRFLGLNSQRHFGRRWQLSFEYHF